MGSFRGSHWSVPTFYSQAKGPMWICGCSGNLQVLSLSITHSGTGDITTGLVSGPSGPTEVGLGQKSISYLAVIHIHSTRDHNLYHAGYHCHLRPCVQQLSKYWTISFPQGIGYPSKYLPVPLQKDWGILVIQACQGVAGCIFLRLWPFLQLVGSKSKDQFRSRSSSKNADFLLAQLPLVSSRSFLLIRASESLRRLC